jgi:TonB family protein
MKHKLIQVARFFLFSFLCLLASSAKAEFELGLKYYEEKNFEKAYREFNQAAKFGDFSAQYNLGVMYYKGQSVKQDIFTGYAWLALAAQDAEYKERGLHTQIYNAFSADQKNQADRVYQEIFAQFNSATIERNLTPSYSGASPLSSQLRPIKNVYPAYPRSMLRVEKMGWVDVLYTVEKDGTTRDHVVYASTHENFSDSVVSALRKWQYEPATIAGKAVAVHGVKIRFMFILDDAKFDERKIASLLAEKREKAISGDANAQFLYAYYLDVLPSFTKYTPKADSEENPNKWYLKAAENGSAISSFFLGKNVLYGNMCAPDANKSTAWLLRASKNVVDAQYLLALELLSGSRLQKNEEQALYWLNKAVSGNSTGNSAAKLRLAWILSTHPDQDQRNGPLAQQYVLSVDQNYRDKQTYYETAAAVAAENADFDEAAKWQEKVLDDATSLELPLENIRAQLNAYRSKQPLRVAL